MRVVTAARRRRPGRSRGAVLEYYIARAYWGRGLATEAGQAFVKYGFEVLGLTSITAGMNARNVASIRVAEKLGFVRVRSGEGGGNRWFEYELNSCVT